MHRRELEQGLCCLRNFIFYKHEPPKLISIPIVVVDRLVQARSLERVQPKINEDRPIGFYSPTKPTVGLIDEPVLEVIDANRAERRFGKVKYLMAF